MDSAAGAVPVERVLELAETVIQGSYDEVEIVVDGGLGEVAEGS